MFCCQPYHLFEPFLDVSLPILDIRATKTTKSKNADNTPGNADDPHDDTMRPFLLSYMYLLSLYFLASVCCVRAWV